MTRPFRRELSLAGKPVDRPTAQEAAEGICTLFVGASQWTRAAADAVATLATDDRPVVVEGEPGAGKEFLARLIHRCSGRSSAPFVGVPKRNVPMHAVRALIMDVRRLTAAQPPRSTWLERARGGVLFLDMTSLLLLLPPDELEAVTCRESFCEVGARALATSDVRVVLGVTSAARPGSQPASGLAQSAALGVLPVWPLRERRDDIEPLVRHFVGETCRLARREPNEISAEALAVLRRYDWPGNVDELRRVVDHMIRCSRPACLDSSLIPQHVAIGPSAGRRSPSDLEKGLGGRVRDFEQALICDALARCQGNLSAAARLLGVSVSTLHSKQKQYGAVARATEG